MSRSTFLYVSFWLILAVSVREAYAQYQIIEPDPYRGNERVGRLFSYDEQSFIDRFTYRFDPEDVTSWNHWGEGLRVTGGSVSRDEMYLIAQFKERWLVNGSLFATFRYQKDEDFDSRYNRELFGAGVMFGNGWSLTLMSDLQPEKRDTDIQLELQWESAPELELRSNRNSEFNQREFFRFAVVFVDPFYNEKSDEFFYEERPYTLFGEGYFRFLDKGSLHVWMNWNTDTEFRSRDEDFHFSYAQQEGGMTLMYGHPSDLTFLSSIKGQTGSRRWQDALQRSNQKLSRENLVADLEFRARITPASRAWFGIRYFLLEEEVSESEFSPIDESDERTENYLHFGILYTVSDSIMFRPGVYLNFLQQNQKTEDLLNPVSSSRSIDTGRITFPLQIWFPRYHSTLTINPTLEWPGHPFGGLGIQVRVQL